MGKSHSDTPPLFHNLYGVETMIWLLYWARLLLEVGARVDVELKERER